MSQLHKHFQPRQHNESKNKQNNLSFRNIANNIHQHTQLQNSNINYIHNNQLKVDKSFRSICPDESRASFYTSGEDLQQELNYVGSCINHSNKLAEYQETISQQQYCKLCAAKLASLGYKLQHSLNSVQRDISPSINRFRSKDQRRIMKNHTDIFQSKIKQNLSTHIPPPVKFSTIISQKNKMGTLQSRFEQSQRIIEEYMEIYTEKIEKIQQLLNDFRIKETQHVQKLKSQNKLILQQALNDRDNFEVEKSNFDLFGKSIFKESSSIQGVKFKLPTDERVEKLQTILALIEQTIKDNNLSATNRIPLIKSFNSTQSNQNNINTNNKITLKNSSSISNLSTKSNFKKQKKNYQNGQKFGSQVNQGKLFKNDEIEIQSSRFSSNSAVIRKKSHQSILQNNMIQSTQFNRQNILNNSSQDSDSCQDTPESIKSKISAKFFLLPKNAAVTMFEKINVCESIDIMPEGSLKQARINCFQQEESQQKEIQNTIHRQQNNKQNGVYKSSYVNKSENKSVKSRGRKSFHRYMNFNNQE